MSTKITPAVAFFTDDPTISPDQDQVAFGGAAVACVVGQQRQVAVLPANTANAQVPFPIGLATAGVLLIWASVASDLVVTFKGETMNLPVGQVAAFYGVTPSQVTVSSVLGGEVQTLVGG